MSNVPEKEASFVVKSFYILNVLKYKTLFQKKNLLLCGYLKEYETFSFYHSIVTFDFAGETPWFRIPPGSGECCER